MQFRRVIHACPLGVQAVSLVVASSATDFGRSGTMLQRSGV